MNNDSAFPKIASIELDGDRYNQKGQVFYHASGLTKRELFAAMAMQGLVSGNALHGRFSTYFTSQSTLGGQFFSERKEIGEIDTYKNLAIQAVQYADALIAELSKSEKGGVA